MNFKVGQIYFWNGGGWLGSIIRKYNLLKFKRSDVTHCGIIAAVSQNEVLIYEATEKGFVKSYYPIPWLCNKIDLGFCYIGQPREETRNVLENCQKYEGRSYAWIDYLAIGLAFIFPKIKISGENSLICSEAVARVRYDSSKTINFAKEYGISYDTLTPEHIFLSKQIKILTK